VYSNGEVVYVIILPRVQITVGPIRGVFCYPLINSPSNTYFVFANVFDTLFRFECEYYFGSEAFVTIEVVRNDSTGSPTVLLLLSYYSSDSLKLLNVRIIKCLVK